MQLRCINKMNNKDFDTNKTLFFMVELLSSNFSFYLFHYVLFQTDCSVLVFIFLKFTVS